MCRIEGCEGKERNKSGPFKGLCEKHRHRIRVRGFYEYETPIERILSKTVLNELTGCWEWKGYTYSTGQGSISIDNKPTLVYRAVYEFYYGKIPEGLLACHKCDNHSCVNPNHIFLGTYKDNSQDAAKKGRLERGSKRKLSKLKEEDIFMIRKDSRQQRTIAKDYNVSQCTIYRIKNNLAWSWLT
jgi:hypothetical protein